MEHSSKIVTKLLGVYLDDITTNGNVVENINVDNSCRVNAIKLLVSLGNYGHSICEVIWIFCTKFVQLIDIKKINEIDEKNVKIFFTPEGQLFNTDVIEQFVFKKKFNKKLKKFFLEVLMMRLQQKI